MKNLFKIMSIMLVLLFTASFAIFANGVSEESEVLSVYHGYFQDDWSTAVEMRKIYENFKMEYPNNQIEFIAVNGGQEEIIKKLNNELAANKMLDFVNLSGAPVPKSAIVNNLIQDLKPIIDNDSVFKKQIGKNYEVQNIDGKIYTLQTSAEMMGFWYNKDLFVKAGAKDPTQWNSFDDMFMASEKLRASGFIPYRLTDWPLSILAAAVLSENETTRYNLNNKQISESIIDELKPQLLVLAKELSKNAYDIAPDGSDNRFSTQFFNGIDNEAKVAICFNGVWDAASVIDSPFKDSIKYSIFPNSISYNTINGGFIFSSKLSEAKKDTALKFIRYMFSDKVQSQLVSDCAEGAVSQNINFEEITKQSDDPATRALGQAVSIVNTGMNSTITVESAWGSKINNAMILSLISCSKGATNTPEEAVDEAIKAMKASLK